MVNKDLLFVVGLNNSFVMYSSQFTMNKIGSKSGSWKLVFKANWTWLFLIFCQILGIILRFFKMEHADFEKPWNMLKNLGKTDKIFVEFALNLIFIYLSNLNLASFETNFDCCAIERLSRPLSLQLLIWRRLIASWDATCLPDFHWLFVKGKKSWKKRQKYFR